MEARYKSQCRYALIFKTAWAKKQEANPLWRAEIQLKMYALAYITLTIDSSSPLDSSKLPSPASSCRWRQKDRTQKGKRDAFSPFIKFLAIYK